MRQTSFVAACLCLFAATAARAAEVSILARCGPSSGQTYSFEGGVIGPGQGGWGADGFKDGAITAYINENGDLDLLLKDAISARSYLASRNKVVLVNFEKSNRSFLVYSTGVNFVETFLFKLNEYGIGSLVWTTSKATSMSTRSGIMFSKCGPEFAIGGPPK